MKRIKKGGGRRESRRGGGRGGAEANGRHPTGSVGRARCQRLAHTHTRCPASPPQGIPQGGAHPPGVAQPPPPSASRRALVVPGMPSFLQVDDSLKGRNNNHSSNNNTEKQQQKNHTQTLPAHPERRANADLIPRCKGCKEDAKFCRLSPPLVIQPNI